MTLDDLVKLFKDGAREAFGKDADEMHRAGIRAVVEALRDEISMNCTLDDDYSVYRWLDKILASDGVEADSGGAFGGLMDGLAKACAPAAAPVCEWIISDVDITGYGRVVSTCAGYESFKRDNPALFPRGTLCVSCGKPISFKSEAAR